jgi:hypothetical protein
VAEPAAAAAAVSLLGGEQQLMEFLFTSLDAGCEGLMLKVLDGPGRDCCCYCCCCWALLLLCMTVSPHLGLHHHHQVTPCQPGSLCQSNNSTLVPKQHHQTLGKHCIPNFIHLDCHT